MPVGAQDSAELYARFFEQFSRTSNHRFMEPPINGSSVPRIHEFWGLTPLITVNLTSSDSNLVTLDPPEDELIDVVVGLMEDMAIKVLPFISAALWGRDVGASAAPEGIGGCGNRASEPKTKG